MISRSYRAGRTSGARSVGRRAGRLVGSGLGTLVVSAFLFSGAAAQDQVPALGQYLRRIGLSAEEIAAADSGRAVVQLLPTKHKRDLAVFGIIRVRAAPDTVVAYAQPERFLSGQAGRFHIFGTPPTSADVQDLAFAESEYRDLEKCRPGDCDFKLPGSAMPVFVQKIDWSAPGAKAEADQRLRASLLRLTTDYIGRGNAAILSYDDVHGVRSSEVFLELTAPSGDLYEYPPELRRHLTTYPSGRPEQARDVLYWSEFRLPKLRPTLTLNHAVVYQPTSPLSSATLIARKQLFASHYFEGAFELLSIVNGAWTPTEPGAYLLLVRRFRLDNLPDDIRNLRGRVRSQLAGATRSELERHRSALESSQPQ